MSKLFWFYDFIHFIRECFEVILYIWHHFFIFFFIWFKLFLKGSFLLVKNILKFRLYLSDKVSLFWEEFVFKFKVFFFSFFIFCIWKSSGEIKSSPNQYDIKYKKYWYKYNDRDIESRKPEKIYLSTCWKNTQINRK